MSCGCGGDCCKIEETSQSFLEDKLGRIMEISKDPSKIGAKLSATKGLTDDDIKSAEDKDEEELASDVSNSVDLKAILGK